MRKPSIAPTGIETWVLKPVPYQRPMPSIAPTGIETSCATSRSSSPYPSHQLHLRVLKHFLGASIPEGHTPSIAPTGIETRASLYHRHRRPNHQLHLRVLKLRSGKTAKLRQLPSIAPTGIETKLDDGEPKSLETINCTYGY